MVFALIMYLLGLEIQYRDGMIVKKNSFQAFLFAVRPNTLTAAVAPVLIGSTLAALDLGQDGLHFQWIPYLLCICFAVGMQISSNLINDYFDFKKGSDDKQERLGPPRACSMGWVDLPVMKRWIILVITLSLLFGLPLVIYGGINLIWIGVICVLFAFLYTTFFASKGLGDLLVVLFFGIIPVNFTFYVETLKFSQQSLFLSLGIGLVVDTLLVVNNFRDVEQDAASGKKTLAVLLGKQYMPALYLILGFAGVFASFVMLNHGYWIPILAVSPYIIFHIMAYVKMKRIGKGKQLNQILGASATNIFIYGFLLSAGLLIQKFLL